MEPAAKPKLTSREEARRAVFAGIVVGVLGTIFSEPNYGTAQLFDRTVGGFDYRWVLAISVCLIIYGIWMFTKDTSTIQRGSGPDA